MNSNKAFSLIELSIVLIIIGLLVAGITGGKSLIENAKNRALINEIRGWKQAVNAFYLLKERLPGDLNNDGKVDVAEYGSSILAADMLSKSETPNSANVDGTINKKGFDAVLSYTQKSNIAAATKLYSNIYNTYNLGEAQKDFKAD